MNDKLSNSFQCQTGVRQSDNLSPAIYLQDLEQFLQDKYNGTKLFVLMYADDTIFLAESEEDVQDALSAMLNYYNKRKLQVIVKKTKIVVFKRKDLEICKFVLLPPN